MIRNTIIALSYIFWGLTIGYSIQLLEKRRIIRLTINLEKFRKILQKVGLLFFFPISIIGALWIVKIDNIKIFTLPFLGIFALFIGGILGLIAAKYLHMERKDVGAMFACGSFTNIGSI